MKVIGTIVEVAQLGRAIISEMFELFDRYFLNANRSQFEADLLAKDQVILLMCKSKIIGFSTLQLINETINHEPVIVLYSGDTIMDAEYWSTTELQRNFVTYAVDQMLQHSKPFYWLLICSGYRTYRYLPLFFRDFWPHHEKETPENINIIMHELATRRFGDRYHDGVVVDSNGQLRDHVSPIDDRLLNNPHISFFIKTNPNHALGHELVCLAQITQCNLTRAVSKIVSSLEENANPVHACK
jgi:hypothetical protein